MNATRLNSDAQESWQVGDVYYQADIWRNGEAIDRQCPKRLTKEESESDLADALNSMTDREREQSQDESFVQAWRITSIDDDGRIGGSESADA